ncbi:MAG TPA: penicillin acylase family protein [Gammaproteobacteria bacterium]|nr:penicillin acylase family protein [Gammaproteobacteria bacterium]
MRIDWLKWLALGLLAAILVLAAAAYLVARASLPRRSGQAVVPHLRSPLAIELDARAVPRIHGSTFEDALRGQGYQHAQERFFQMDLMRRAAAGELAALVGPRALPLDRAQRPFDLRRVAREMLARLPAREAAWLDAYTEGVNAGLADFSARTPEYWLLRARPEAWKPEDSVLVVLGLYTHLSNNDVYERPQSVLHEVLPEALYEFLTPSTSRFDRPLVAAEGDPTAGYVPRPIPGPDVVDLRTRTEPGRAPRRRVSPPLLVPASNQWALAAPRGARGEALLANDPHLELRLPNVFYRCELEWPEGVVRGVSIPGLPGVIIGANATLAWGATVSNADQADWVVVDVVSIDGTRYATPDGTGSEPFRRETFTIAVAGGASEPLEVDFTRWGPVVGADAGGRPLALHATWLERDGLNLDLLDLSAAASVADGVAVLKRWAGPSLNWALADASGAVAWVVNGPLPRRVGFDGSRPVSWADGRRSWSGEQPRPALLDPTKGAVFTANNRTLPAAPAAALSRMWMSPVRAARIAELLGEHATLDERESLAMQLDTRVAAFDQIRDVVLEVVPADETDPLLARAREHVALWDGHANLDQPGFRILYVYYLALLERALGPLLSPAIDSDPAFVYRWPLADEPLHRLLDERPAHMLTSEHSSWPEFLRAVLRDALREIDADPSRPGSDAPWREVNVLAVEHPFAGLPVIGTLLRPWLRLPALPVPGSPQSLRVATPSYGALVRMDVSPAHPEDGILEMSAGQSGHFLSPNFADQQADWLAGAPAPFLAGPAVSRIVLVP